MNKQSNTYIITYAAILVVVVASVLAFAAIGLQPLQQRNIEIEKKGAILETIGAGSDPEKLSADKAGYIESEYEAYIVANYAVDERGDTVEGVDAFGLLDDLAGGYEAGTFPVFEAVRARERQYILPITGKGMWGSIWGYIALADDRNTIVGAVFDHTGETPGLGARIADAEFEKQFIGKTLFDTTGKFTSVTLLKGKGVSAGNPHAVDAVSGGTITSNGVKAMLGECLKDYVPFLQKAAHSVEAVSGATPATTAIPAAGDDSTQDTLSIENNTENTEHLNGEGTIR